MPYIVLAFTICALVITLDSAGSNLLYSAFAQQSSTKNVDIVQGAAARTDDAYSPNPIEVVSGATVIWTNQDTAAHTVTSGDSGEADGQFDSPILSSGMQFSHTFDKVGDFQYYCSLHPNMVGTVVVTAGGGTPPAIELTAQTDKEVYQPSETVTVRGSAPAGQAIAIRILNPTGSVYRMDQVVSTSAESYTYSFTVGGPLGGEGQYQVIVSTDQQRAQTEFAVQRLSPQNPSISITQVSNESPRFGIDVFEVSGTVKVECSELAVALICPPQTGTILWGDGETSTFDADASPNWGPISHTYSSAGAVEVSAILSKMDDGEESMLAKDSTEITVLKHKTLLSEPKLSSQEVEAGKTFQVLEAKLIDVDSQSPIEGKTISFSGSAPANQPPSAVSTRDGSFESPVDVYASSSGSKTLYASFAGDDLYEPTRSVEVHIAIKTAPATGTTVIKDCASPLECLDTTMLAVLGGVIVAIGGGVTGYKLLKKKPPIQKPRVFVKSRIQGYIELDGDKFDDGGRY